MSLQTRALSDLPNGRGGKAMLCRRVVRMRYPRRACRSRCALRFARRLVPRGVKPANSNLPHRPAIEHLLHDRAQRTGRVTGQLAAPPGHEAVGADEDLVTRFDPIGMRVRTTSPAGLEKIVADERAVLARLTQAPPR